MCLLQRSECVLPRILNNVIDRLALVLLHTHNARRSRSRVRPINDHSMYTYGRLLRYAVRTIATTSLPKSLTLSPVLSPSHTVTSHASPLTHCPVTPSHTSLSLLLRTDNSRNRRDRQIGGIPLHLLKLSTHSGTKD